MNIQLLTQIFYTDLLAVGTSALLVMLFGLILTSDDEKKKNITWLGLSLVVFTASLVLLPIIVLVAIWSR